MPWRARLAIPDIARPIIQRENNRSPCSYSEDVARILEPRVTPGKSGRPRRTAD